MPSADDSISKRGGSRAHASPRVRWSVLWRCCSGSSVDRVSDSYTSRSDLPSHGTRRGGAWILLGCVFVLCMGFGVLQKTRTALVREAFRDGAAATCQTLLDRVDGWRGRVRAPGELPGVVFGDSVFLSLRDPK